MCILWNQYKSKRANVPSDTSVIALAQRVESTGTGGDRSVNSLYSRRYVNSSSLLKEWKRKEKKIQNVVGEESDENVDVKTK